MVPRPRSCLSIPLTHQGSLVGVLSLYSTSTESFTEDHQRIVEVVSRQVSTIVKTAAEFDRNKSIALRDQVTGLPNIEHLYQLTRSYAGSDYVGEPFSIIVLDIERLSDINSSFGKAVGDQILARVVRATRRSLRGGDFLFRYRDDEFVVLLLQTDADTSAHVVGRIQEALKREADLASPRFSVSIGAATSLLDAKNIEDLIDLANSRVRRRSQSDPPAKPSQSIH